MSPQWTLLARLDDTLARLEQARKAIGAAGLETRLHKRIGADLALRLSQHTETLKGRRKKVAAGQVTPNVWAEVKSAASLALLDECLLYLQAARSRGPDAAPDICEITDTLFEELGDKSRNLKWRSFSVFAGEDSFDFLTKVIRLRYPLSGVWDMPVAVHEFGHFVAARLQQERPDGSISLVFQTYKDAFLKARESQAAPANSHPSTGQPAPASQPGADWRVYLDEVFADVFATYAAGPCFACSCLLLRFDPAGAQDEADGKHPSFAKRAYLILQTLRRLNNEQPGRGKLAAVIQILDKSWRDACDAAGASPDLSPPDQVWIDAQASRFYYMLKTGEPGLRFSDWAAAGARQAWLQAHNPPDPPPEFSLIQLLNAAWMARTTENSSAKLVDENFLKLARRNTVNYDK